MLKLIQLQRSSVRVWIYILNHVCKSPSQADLGGAASWDLTPLETLGRTLGPPRIQGSCGLNLLLLHLPAFIISHTSAGWGGKTN